MLDRIHSIFQPICQIWQAIIMAFESVGQEQLTIFTTAKKSMPHLFDPLSFKYDSKCLPPSSLHSTSVLFTPFSQTYLEPMPNQTSTPQCEFFNHFYILHLSTLWYVLSILLSKHPLLHFLLDPPPPPLTLPTPQWDVVNPTITCSDWWDSGPHLKKELWELQIPTYVPYVVN